MKPIRLILVPALATEPAPFLVIRDGVASERGVLTPDPVESPEPMRTVAIVSGTDVTVRWLDLPAGGAVQQRAATLWLLKQELATSADRMVVALGSAPAPGLPRLVAVTSAALLQAWTDYLEALGVRADVLLPDALTLPEPDADDALVAVAFGPHTALRGRGFAASVQTDLVDLVAGMRRIQPIAEPAEVERALIAAALSPPVDLLSARDRPRDAGSRSWARAAGLAAALLASPLVLIGAAAARDDISARTDIDRAHSEIARVLPDLAREADPVRALDRRIRAAPPPGGVVAATAGLFTAVERVEGAELDLLIVHPEEGMKASITHDNHGDIQAIDGVMRSTGLTLTETSTLEDRGRIVSDVMITGVR